MSSGGRPESVEWVVDVAYLCVVGAYGSEVHSDSGRVVVRADDRLDKNKEGLTAARMCAIVQQQGTALQCCPNIGNEGTCLLHAAEELADSLVANGDEDRTCYIAL